MKKVTILGSTGSIGTQALEIIRSNSDKFKISALTCGEQAEVFAQQILEFQPEYIAVGSESSKEKLINLLKDKGIEKAEIGVGEDGIVKAATYETDIVLNSLMGMRGLVPTLEAIGAGHDIAFANKETLVAGGQLVMESAKKKGVKMLPVDSEHSAIFQCLEGNKGKEISRILLTASGGPFRGWTRDKLKNVTPEMALKHPNWTMGQKITIDSATMMNKGLEIIEAMWLFDVPVENIEVLVHPQSIVHSAVEFKDTAVLAELGTPDMKVPIALALAYPDRLDLDKECQRVDFFNKASNLTFEKPDAENFKCLALALRAAKLGGTYPAVMNGANEVLVDLFLKKKIGFLDIPDIIEEIMDQHQPLPADKLENILSADGWARERAMEIAETIESNMKGGN